jgi:hypothetical protein
MKHSGLQLSGCKPRQVPSDYESDIVPCQYQIEFGSDTLRLHCSTHACACTHTRTHARTHTLLFFTFMCVIDLPLLILIFRIKHEVFLETGVMTSQMISHFQVA